MSDDVDEGGAKTGNGDGSVSGPLGVPRYEPIEAYTRALRHYDGARLVEIVRTLGLSDIPAGRVPLSTIIAETLLRPRVAEARLADSPPGARIVAGLFALTERTDWPLHALAFTLECLAVEPRVAVVALLEQGLIVAEIAPGTTLRSFDVFADRADDGVVILRAHPSMLTAARTVLPQGPSLPVAAAVKLPRESDGLEPIIRMAALWQRVADSPLRQTQQGSIYKRDRERLEDDPVLAGPIADALEPLPDMPALWLALATGVGLIAAETGTERVIASDPGFWSDNAFHLAQMTAQRWLSLNNWHEIGGFQREGAVLDLATPYARPAVLLWLATLPEQDWVATEDLAGRLQGCSAQWDKASFVVASPVNGSLQGGGGGAPAKRGTAKKPDVPPPSGKATLEAILLGPAYQLGLVRAAEEVPSGRRVVQLTPLGRYVLMLGPPPGPRPDYEHFLFVQPNFEAIAYRQGLNAGLVGRLSRFTYWTQVGAALAFRLTPESVYRGLEGGMNPQDMLALLAKHSSRPLHPGVAESVRIWAERRDRVTYHASATLIEFVSPADLEAAMSQWPAGESSAPQRVSERLLLVEGNGPIPFQRFRMAGSRDYRREPEACIEVGLDGISLALDLARSDLLVDAELAQFTDEVKHPNVPWAVESKPRRRFRITSDSLARGIEAGMTPQSCSSWFLRRTGQDSPPSVRLLLSALLSTVDPLETSRPLVVHTPTSELLDGLAQHPETRRLLGERLGPTSVVVDDANLPVFRLALERLGLELAGSEPP